MKTPGGIVELFQLRKTEAQYNVGKEPFVVSEDVAGIWKKLPEEMEKDERWHL